MKVCIIGGTGTLSTPFTDLLIQDNSFEITMINRGTHKDKLNPKIKLFISDINDEEKMTSFLEDKHYDVVINFINYRPEEIKRDIKYFKGKTNQYIFISTNVVLNHHEHVHIDENTPIGNRISEYGQEKARCEEVLKSEKDFPYTIVRPSHTYSDDRFPVTVKSSNTWTVIDRIKNKEPVIMHDSGQSIWPITHANDFAKLLFSLVGEKSAIHEIYHIMNPMIVSWDMIYQEIARQTDGEYKPVYIPTEILAKTSEYNFKDAIQGDKMYSNIFNVDKILKLNPGFEFEVDVEKGFKMYLAYMDAHPELKEVDQAFNTWQDTLINNYQNHLKDFTRGL